MTLAPASPNSIVHHGPARTLERSKTRKPRSGDPMVEENGQRARDLYYRTKCMTLFSPVLSSDTNNEAGFSK
jgi:phage portal protein BeeE